MPSHRPAVNSVFATAAQSFVDLVTTLPADSWEGPGLGDWDLRALVGHTSRSLITVSTYLRTPAEQEDVTSPAQYYARVRSYMADSSDIVERGRAAGRDLGTDPAGAVAELAARALADVGGAGDPLIAVIGGLGIRLSNYLPTRTFELAVHCLDISRATGVPLTLPPEVLESANTLAIQIAAQIGQGDTVLLALAGRGSLPGGFSVV